MWGTFPDKASALAAIAKINTAMGIPVSADAVTRRWADLMVTADSKQSFVLPAADKLGGATGYVQETKPNWPADPGLP